MSVHIPRLMLAAPMSGSGKTTLTCALLRALQKMGETPSAFKCGPDYIDPMFHTRVTGAECCNLDLFFTEEETAKGLLAEHAQKSSVAVFEGVMGYYDGVGGKEPASSYDLARATRTPVVLVVNPKGASLSLAALVRGFAQFRPEANIRGILLNRCSRSLCEMLTPLLEQETGIPVLGFLPELPECRIESRHLGLVTAGEIADLRERVERLADELMHSADLNRLIELARSAPTLDAKLPAVSPVTDGKPRIAVARDEAFCFYYEDNLRLLEKLGAELSFFSPLRDDALPPNSCALYIGGGYPELYAEALSHNTVMRSAVRSAVLGGMPTVAECGGFQYLQQRLKDTNGVSFDMVGAIASESFPTGRLSRFGYVTLTAQQDTLLCKKGEKIRAHEFHYWDSTVCGDGFIAKKPGGKRSWNCVVAQKNLFAGYPHLYFYSNPAFAKHFVRVAEEYQKR